jgi:hypothetical protein
MWLHFGLVWLIFSPVALAFQVMPDPEHQWRVLGQSDHGEASDNHVHIAPIVPHSVQVHSRFRRRYRSKGILRYRAAAIKSEMPTPETCGLADQHVLACPNRHACDSPKQNAMPTMPTRARLSMIPRILIILGAARFVFMAPLYSPADRGC